MIRKREVKKNLLLIRYLIEEEVDCISLCEIAKQEIETSIRQMHYDMNVWDSDLDAKPENTQKCNIQTDEEIFESSTHPKWIKSVYRKIAMVTHPDKQGKLTDKTTIKKRVEDYQQAKISLDEKDYIEVLIIAENNDIDISEIENIDITFFDKKRSQLTRSINTLKTSLFWRWSHSTDDEKEKILQEFIRSRGWDSKESQRKKSRGGSGKHPGKSISQMKKSKLLKK